MIPVGKHTTLILDFLNPSTEVRADTFETNIITALKFGHVGMVRWNTVHFLGCDAKLSGACIDYLIGVNQPDPDVDAGCRLTMVLIKRYFLVSRSSRKVQRRILCLSIV